MKQKPLIILTGPTAVGKTELSIELARSVNGAIISADSMQVYKHMDIGSAKIKKEEMQGIPHYLVDCLEPWEEFNVVRFQKMAQDALGEIYEQGKLPIVTGGTGFYIQALLNDIDFTECTGDSAYRKELEHIASTKGRGTLHQMLEQVDPESARSIHENNEKRIIRALEYYHQTGETISEHNEKQRQKSPAYNAAYFVLNLPRPQLYERIDRRVDQMMDKGLVKEVQELLDMGCSKNMVSMQGLGYKELIDYLNGACTLDEAVYIVKRDTRHFAKRQLTWFSRERDVLWIDKEQFANEQAILKYMLDILKERQILS